MSARNAKWKKCVMLLIRPRSTSACTCFWAGRISSSSSMSFLCCCVSLFILYFFRTLLIDFCCCWRCRWILTVVDWGSQLAEKRNFDWHMSFLCVWDLLLKFFVFVSYDKRISVTQHAFCVQIKSFLALAVPLLLLLLLLLLNTQFRFFFSLIASNTCTEIGTNI